MCNYDQKVTPEQVKERSAQLGFVITKPGFAEYIADLCNQPPRVGPVPFPVNLVVAHGQEEVTMDEANEWIIQRCTQKWGPGFDLQYEDFPTPEGLMTRSQMLAVLDRVGHEHPESEFRGHKVIAAQELDHRLRTLEEDRRQDR